MSKRFFSPFFVVLLVAFLATHCKKTPPPPLLQCNFTTPLKGSLFTLPDTILIGFTIESEVPLQRVRVSIDNKDLIPISQVIYLQQNSTTQQHEMAIAVNRQTEPTSTQAYIHVMTNNGTEVNHCFLEIGVTNAPFVAMGWTAITSTTATPSEIFQFNNEDELLQQFSFAGIATQAITIPSAKLLVVSTLLPEYLLAFRTEDQELIWSQEAPLPYPEFQSLTYQKPDLIYGTGAGQVIVLNAETGLQKVATPLFDNYFTTAVATTQDQLVFSQNSRTGNTSKISTCYLTTGAIQQDYLTSFEGLSATTAPNSQEVLFVGNLSDSGCIINFYPKENRIINTQMLATGTLHQSLFMEDHMLLLSNKNHLYTYHLANKLLTSLYLTNDSITDLCFDPTSSRLYIAHGQKVSIHDYPSMTTINTLPFNKKVVAIAMSY